MAKPMTLPFYEYRDKLLRNEAARLTALRRWALAVRSAAPLLGLLGVVTAHLGNILGSYFPSWMVCALVGCLYPRRPCHFQGLWRLLDELPIPFVVMLAIACAGTFAMWLIWLS